MALAAPSVHASMALRSLLRRFPAHHAHGGMTGYGASVPSLIKHGETVIEGLPLKRKLTSSSSSLQGIVQASLASALAAFVGLRVTWG